jgi:intracellular sulfur oxidation DsrE/DsrF family protein
MTKKILTGMLMILALAVLGTSQTKSHVHKVVFENNSPAGDAWTQLMGNIENIKTAFAPDEVQIEVVNLGKGLAFLQKTNSANEARIKKLVDAGVVFDACQNSMRLRHVTTEDLFPFAAQVDSGVAQVVRKQEAGYSYVKGGE